MEEPSALLPEASVAEAVDESVDSAVEVDRTDDDGIHIPATLRKVVAPVHWVPPDRPEQHSNCYHRLI